MAIALAIFGVAIAAFCVWLGVRIVNRRERWAKWTLIGLVVLAIAYPLSFGPACWIAGDNETALDLVPNVYYPILWISRMERPGAQGQIDGLVEWYSTHCRSDGAWPLLTPDGECVWGVPPDYTAEELENLAEQERSK